MGISEKNPLRDPHWERQKYETASQFRYFVAYRDLPYGLIHPDTSSPVPPVTRTLEKVAKLHKVSLTRMAELSSAWKWVERARDYDSHLDRIEQEERRRVRREYARKMEERTLQYREDAAGLYPQLMSKIHGMLQFPLAEPVEVEELSEEGVPTGETKIVLKPVRWNLSTLARFIQSLEQLARFAAGVDENGILDKLLERVDPAALTPEQRQRIINGEPIFEVIIGASNNSLQVGGSPRTDTARIED